MEITYKTELSELINVGEVSGKTSEISSIITEYSDIVDESIRTECTTHLSEETFIINNDPLIFNKITPLVTSGEIDTSALDNIVSLAQKKRKEELDSLHKAVYDHISDLEERKNSKVLEKNKLQIFNILGHNDSAINVLSKEIASIEKEIEKYRKKLETIDGERNGF